MSDIPLSATGIKQAEAASHIVHDHKVDIAFSSVLLRTIQTLNYVMMATPHIQQKHIQELNERSYGALEGMTHDEASEKFGADQVRSWRRSYFDRPPNGESLFDLERRVAPVLDEMILPLVRSEKTVLIVSHSGTLRALIRLLLNIEPEDAAKYQINCCQAITIEKPALQ